MKRETDFCFLETDALCFSPFSFILSLSFLGWPLFYSLYRLLVALVFMDSFLSSLSISVLVKITSNSRIKKGFKKGLKNLPLSMHKEEERDTQE